MRGMERKKGQPVEKLKGEGTTTIRRDSGGGGSGSSKKASSRNFRGKQQRPMSTHTVSSRLQDVVKTIVEVTPFTSFWMSNSRADCVEHRKIATIPCATTTQTSRSSCTSRTSTSS